MREIIMLVSTTKTPKGRRTRRPEGVAANLVEAGIAEYVDADPEASEEREVFATERAAERAAELEVDPSALELGAGTAAGGRWGVKDVEAYARARDEAATEKEGAGEEGGSSEPSGDEGGEGEGEGEGDEEEEADS